MNEVCLRSKFRNSQSHLQWGECKSATVCVPIGNLMTKIRGNRSDAYFVIARSVCVPYIVIKVDIRRSRESWLDCLN